jgi:hypothetical protein
MIRLKRGARAIILATAIQSSAHLPAPLNDRATTRSPALLRIARFPFAALTIALLATFSLKAQAAPAKTAFFPFEFIDSGDMSPSTRPPPEPEAARLALIAGLLKERLTGSGAYAPIALNGSGEAIAKAPALRDCQRCADEIANAAGAEIAVVGYVQKVSNLILNINVRISNATSGQVLAAASADIRGNTDESWTRGIEWIVKNRLLAKPQQQ